MSATITSQLLAAATWAESTPGYEATARPLRWLARMVTRGDLDLSRLPPPSPTESVWSGLVARLRRIGVDVWEMCPCAEAAT